MDCTREFTNCNILLLWRNHRIEAGIISAIFVYVGLIYTARRIDLQPPIIKKDHQPYSCLGQLATSGGLEHNNHKEITMKKTFLFSMTLILWAILFHATTLSSYARGNDKIISETIQYFEDGSSMTITVIEESPIMRGTIYSKSGSKKCVMTNKSGSEICSFTVHGTFSVNPGVSSSCTAASYSIDRKSVV